MCTDAAPLCLHWTVIRVPERVPAGHDVVGIRVSTCWPEDVALRRWTRFVPGGGRLEHLFAGGRVQPPPCFLIGNSNSHEKKCFLFIKGTGCNLMGNEWEKKEWKQQNKSNLRRPFSLLYLLLKKKALNAKMDQWSKLIKSPHQQF